MGLGEILNGSKNSLPLLPHLRTLPFNLVDTEMSQPNQISITPPKVYDALNAPFSESVSNELAKTDLNELNYLCHEISLVACSVRVKFDKNTIQALKVPFTLFIA